MAALREAAEVKMETKAAEKVATYCYRNILSRDAVVSLYYNNASLHVHSILNPKHFMTRKEIE